MTIKSKTTGTAGIKGRRDTNAPSLADKNRASASRSGRTSKDKTTAVSGPDQAYLNLIRRFPLRPIRTEAELEAASAVIDELPDRDDLSLTESDFLDVLGDLGEKYESLLTRRAAPRKRHRFDFRMFGIGGAQHGKRCLTIVI
jgi:hypothetical protein